MKESPVIYRAARDRAGAPWTPRFVLGAAGVLAFPLCLSALCGCGAEPASNQPPSAGGGQPTSAKAQPATKPVSTSKQVNWQLEKDKARIGAAKEDLLKLVAGLAGFKLDCGRWPTTEEGLAVLEKKPANEFWWSGPYPNLGGKKDPWGNPYVYRCPGMRTPESYDLYSFGPDGREGGGDDIYGMTILEMTPVGPPNQGGGTDGIGPF